MDFGIMSWFGLVDGWLSRVVVNYAFIDANGRVIDLNRL